MSKPTSRQRQGREAQRRRAQEAAAAEAYRRARRRQAIIGIGVVVGVIAAVVLVLRGAADQRERRAASTTTAAGPTSSAYDSGPPASLPTVAPGAAVEGAAPCPAADGSADRVTRFGAPPPDCLDPAVDYVADLVTTEGTIRVDLYEEDHPGPVNAFVFLARYHYYDGLPFSLVRRGAYAEVADPDDGPGFRQPATGQREASMLGGLFVGLTARGGTTGGGLTVAMPGNDAITIAPDTSPLGMITDALTRRPDAPDETVQMRINNTATPSGAPSDAITITRVDVHECPKGTSCPASPPAPAPAP